MPIALLILLHLNQSPDTTGIRDAIRTSIAAVERKFGDDQDAWIHRSEHIVVDVPSFLKVIGVNTTQAEQWRSILDGIGGRASVQEQTCASGYKGSCPHLAAVGLSRLGSHVDLVIAVNYVSVRYGPTGKTSPRDVYFEVHVGLTRTGSAYRIDNIRYGKMT
jgi:hypothetical protein